MGHYTRFDSARQIPLALNAVAGFDGTSILRSAYRRLDLSRRLSFEQAMSNPACAIGVRNLADAMVRRKLAETRHKRDSTVREMATSR